MSADTEIQETVKLTGLSDWYVGKSFAHQAFQTNREQLFVVVFGCWFVLFPLFCFCRFCFAFVFGLFSFLLNSLHAHKIKSPNIFQ